MWGLMRELLLSYRRQYDGLKSRTKFARTIRVLIKLYVSTLRKSRNKLGEYLTLLMFFLHNNNR